MSSALNRLNLRPAERRFLVVVGLVLFGVINVLFVWPYFGAWGDSQVRLDKARQKLKAFENQIKEKPKYETGLHELEGENPDVPPEDQVYKLVDTIYAQARQSGVNVTRLERATTKTNGIFIEQTQPINFSAGQDELVRFMYNLGAGDSLIRVRSLTVSPELPARQRLGGRMELVASYKRKESARPPAAASARRTTAATQPAAAKPAGPAAGTNTRTVVLRKPNSPAGTNAPAPASWWSRVKSWFGGSSAAPASTARPAAPSTNAPGKNLPTTNRITAPRK